MKKRSVLNRREYNGAAENIAVFMEFSGRGLSKTSRISEIGSLSASVESSGFFDESNFLRLIESSIHQYLITRSVKREKRGLAGQKSRCSFHIFSFL